MSRALENREIDFSRDSIVRKPAKDGPHVLDQPCAKMIKNLVRIEHKLS